MKKLTLFFIAAFMTLMASAQFRPPVDQWHEPGGPERQIGIDQRIVAQTHAGCGVLSLLRQGRGEARG